jgi:mannose-6-phosphate isomerase-like protein (cupin superfamily)
MEILDGAVSFTSPAAGETTHWIEHLRVSDLSVGTYSIPRSGTDDQSPHTEDEIYVVTAGRAVFEAEDDRVAVGPGSVIYVAAGEVHRFVEVTEDLAAVVLFAPPEGSRQAAGDEAIDDRMSWVPSFAADYVATFNTAVGTGDFSSLLARWTDDAVMRFENVPPTGGTLEFTGRPAYTSAYQENPPDDQIDLAGEPTEENGCVIVGFTWRRGQAPGVMRLTVADGLISNVLVTFG